MPFTYVPLLSLQRELYSLPRDMARGGGQPLGFAAGDANLYRYVKNKPTMLTDPSGLIQNNFMVIYPVGYNVRLSQIGNDEVDPVILLFDPWRDLLPRTYFPTPLSRGNRAPTVFFSVNQCAETYYFDNLRDPRFREPNLNLGPRP